MAKEDIRITKTKRALVQTMLSLLEKQSFQKISVNDICNDALVSRSTFYVHFEDKYELLHYCMQELEQQMKGQFEGSSTRDRIKQVLLDIQTRSNLYKNIFANDINNEIQKMLMKIFVDHFTGILQEMEHNGKLLAVPPEFMATFYAGGLAISIQAWIETGFKMPVDDMARYLDEPVHKMLGV